MVNADLGACEWFIYELRRSGLIDRGQLDQVVGDFLKRNPRAEPPALADHLVEQNILSQFQAQRILEGKTQGLVLGPYVLMDSIGQGSMGQVYKALSKTDNTWNAVKVLPRRSMWNVRLARRQVRSFGQFQHPAIVPFMDVGTSGGLHYLVWPLVDGETLDARVQREGKLDAQQTALVGFQIASGLAIAHQNGLFHGLIKPSNLMIGNDQQVRILDFGIGSLLVENEGESLVDTMSTANALTSGLDCCAPESIMEPTNRTPAGDQYSLGCVLYFCLSGRYPFPEGSAVEKMMAHQFKQPTPLAELVPDAPAEIVAVVERLMQKAPEARYAGCDELVEVLKPLAPVVSSQAFVDTYERATGNNISALRPSSMGTSMRPPYAPSAAPAAPPVERPASAPPMPSRSNFRDAPARPGSLAGMGLTPVSDAGETDPMSREPAYAPAPQPVPPGFIHDDSMDERIEVGAPFFLFLAIAIAAAVYAAGYFSGLQIPIPGR